MKKLLIVEDEPILREMYLDRFSGKEFKVFSADSAEKGLALAKQEKPDLILLDILLPKSSGIDLLENLRQNPEIKEMRVLVFSNFDDPETKNKAAKLGVIDYLIKTNYTPRQVSKIVENLLKN